MIVSDWSLVGRVLWDFTVNVLNSMGLVYDFLITPITLEAVDILGYTIFEGFTFTPLFPSIGAIVTLVTLGIIASIVPL